MVLESLSYLSRFGPDGNDSVNIAFLLLGSSKCQTQT